MRLSVSMLTAAAFALATGPAMAQTGPGDEYSGAAIAAPSQATEPTEVFGASSNLLQIPAFGFSPRDSTTVYLQDGFGYMYATSSPSVTTFWAPVDLPAGVVIDRIGLYSFDNDAANSITARLQAYDGATVPATTTIASVATVNGVPMYNYNTATLNHQVNNNPAAGPAGHHYAILIDLPVRSINLRFKAVELRWNRVVSPAPATASFPDMPVGNGQHRFVEALVTAGITGGCGGGLYCPNDPVTRGQMAVFLAVALGLHFPN
jgi:S-layer family protein